MNNAGAICSGSQGFPRFCAEKTWIFYISSKSNLLTSEPIITKSVPAFLFLTCFFNLPNTRETFLSSSSLKTTLFACLRASTKRCSTFESLTCLKSYINPSMIASGFLPTALFSGNIQTKCPAAANIDAISISFSRTSFAFLLFSDCIFRVLESCTPFSRIQASSGNFIKAKFFAASSYADFSEASNFAILRSCELLFTFTSFYPLG